MSEDIYFHMYSVRKLKYFTCTYPEKRHYRTY
jgi:hypothetical protein